MSSRHALFASGRDEVVEVNQRALIDKVLARYSGEHTVFRELLQNADDAGATAAEIIFETRSFLDQKPVGEMRLPDLKEEIVHQWRFRNNGAVFRDEDWNRLKKIAEGNPDEQKIGAFGVGFYSLFSITEEPFVKSGNQWMGFYWKDKKDQLFARRGNLPEADYSAWTSFEMSLREPAQLPARPLDLARFLASSITFMTNLREVSLVFNDKKLVHLTKDANKPFDVAIPRDMLAKATTPKRTMVVRKVTSTPLHITANVLRWVYATGSERLVPTKPLPPKPAAISHNFFSSFLSSFVAPSPSRTPEPPLFPQESNTELLASTESSVVLSVFSAQVDVNLDQKMLTELERATKKRPPRTTTYSLIYTGKDEFEASRKQDSADPRNAGGIFQGLRADLEGANTARVFIGHATGQTTGIGGHMAARFIPTVERESIDLVDRNVSIWNVELLHVGGFLSRIAYETELVTVKRLYDAAVKNSVDMADPELHKWLLDRCLHAMKFFIFRPSTPSPEVSNILSLAFFGASPNFNIYSSVGVRNASNVRVMNPEMKGFIKQLPTLPEEIQTGASEMIAVLQNKHMIRQIMLEDVMTELRGRCLEEAEMVQCIKWRASLPRQPNFDQQFRQQFLSAAVFRKPAEGDKAECLIPLSTIRTYINPGGLVPIDGPFPSHTLPFSLSKQLGQSVLTELFGWSVLNMQEWVAFLTSPPPGEPLGPEHNPLVSPIFAEKLLMVLAKGWPNTSKANQDDIVQRLSGIACAPTQEGLILPVNAYFPGAHIFPDLPVIQFSSNAPIKGQLEKVLTSLGVRKHVDLQLVFTRMIKTGDWTVPQLVKYLTSVRDTLSQEEMNRLQQTAAFFQEVPAESDQATASSIKGKRWKLKDLYEPTDVMRRLGLPVLEWTDMTRWRPGSDEAKLLFGLGLNRFPPLEEIIRMAAGPDEGLRNVALKYFFEKFTAQYASYDPSNEKDASIAFIPATRANDEFLARPGEVFVDPGCAVLGFAVVKSDIRDDALSKLKLPLHPPATVALSSLLKSPPQTQEAAMQTFEYMTNLLGSFTQSQLLQLNKSPIIPATVLESQAINMVRPSDCYFQSTNQADFHSKLFTFVDFGPKANNFLLACGVRHAPTVDEVAKILIANPKRFYELGGGAERYKAELRQLATNMKDINPATVSSMRSAPILLGYRRVDTDHTTKVKDKDNHEKEASSYEEDSIEVVYELLRADQIVLIDDTNAYALFGDSLYAAPQEDILEMFYASLGSYRLSALVKEEYNPVGEVENEALASDIRKLVLERVPLFLHERTQTRILLTPEWLSKPSNFVVKPVRQLILTKILNFQGKRISKRLEASAATQREGRFSVLVLYLATSTQVDMYEVANSLCRVLFKQPKVNDSLLFMTILSTDLRSLRRRGFNVDRILNQQKAEREAKRREAEKEAEKRAAERQPPVREHAKQPSTVPPPQPVSSRPSITLEPTPTSEEKRPTFPQLGELTRPPSIADSVSGVSVKNKGFFGNLKQQMSSKLGRENSSAGDSLERLLPKIPNSSDNGLGGLRTPRVNTAPLDPNAQPTAESDIGANVDQAIQACRPDSKSLLQNTERMHKVKEMLDDGYCDVQGMHGDLVFVADILETRVYAGKDVVDPRNVILGSKLEPIMRFLEMIVTPLKEIYGIPNTSVHVFYNLAGPTIAFNRDGALFLNLRYYEGWHDQQVRNEQRHKALISWYFTLAHEIAHNLVSPHNAEHSYYMSQIAQRYLLKFQEYLHSLGPSRI